MENRPNLTQEIEKLIDQTSLLDVLTALECVTGERAEIIVVMGKDEAKAKSYRMASKRIRATAHLYAAELDGKI